MRYQKRETALSGQNCETSDNLLCAGCSTHRLQPR
jgi:hypothetical protein